MSTGSEPVILDTSFLVAWHNVRDAHHADALVIRDRLREGAFGRLLLTEYVFVEVATVLAARRSLAAAVVVGDLLLRAREIDFIRSSEVFNDAFTVFRSQGTRGLSFADAAIVALARYSGAKYIATFDRGFDNIDGLETIGAVK